MPFRQPHLDIVFPQRSIFMEPSKGDRVDSVYVAEKEHWLPLQLYTYHVDESSRGKEKL